MVIDAKTGKQKARPKKGEEIFYGLRSRRGKITKLDSKFSQAYAKTDYTGLKASFRAGDPSSFQIFQQQTRHILKDKSGKPVYATKHGEIVYKAGKPVKLYKYKLTGKRRGVAQRAVIMGIEGYKQASIGFTKKTARESAKKIILLPVGSRKRSKPIFITGETIKDTVRNLKPDITIKQMVKRKLYTLSVHGDILISKPKNPYKIGSDDWARREDWANSIWGNSTSLKLSFAKVIDRLANFSDSLSVAIREAISYQGLRVTSLVNLQQAEARAEAEDAVMQQDGRRFAPRAGKVIRAPVMKKSKSDVRKSADTYIPLRPENMEDAPIHPYKSVYNAGISIRMTIEGRK